VPDEAPPPNKDSESVAEALGRTAGRLIRTARPRLKEAAEAAKPALESAVQYARDHEDDIKDLATGLVKSRIPAPLRGAVDSVAGKAAPSQPTPATTTVTCAKCGQTNPAAARFCNECGAALTA
jgi:hypothetical protein